VDSDVGQRILATEVLCCRRWGHTVARLSTVLSIDFVDLAYATGIVAVVQEAGAGGELNSVVLNGCSESQVSCKVSPTYSAPLMRIGRY